MSRHPDALPDLPPGDWFLLCVWRPASDATARAIRARWRASLAVLGIRTAEVQSGVLVSLWREGAEALSDSGRRGRTEKHKKA